MTMKTLMVRRMWCAAVTLILLLLVPSAAQAQRLVTPHHQDRSPGPPLSPEEAVARMTVPEGFTVEIVAAEPDIVNPIALCIDEKGRFWITESLEYPRKEPGPGRDRVKVLEDTDGDGRVDKTTVFADGLNIPSGVAVGYGGVWIANSPDILFMQDTDGDLKADRIETVVTGFGRTDTHELPNSLTWGPDGWLYGLNGVFNHSHVKYAEGNPNYDPDHPGWKFTCAMWRLHPRTRKFEVFAEGTSNPWGIAINEDGEFFISACVIDHLWHIVETGYYIRQGGPYPPHTWPMGSIVEHKHQKAAYCGITWFDSDAYPEEYRGVLYMGNIHGGCINADIAERHGSTYKAKPHPGFRAKPQAFDGDDNRVRKIGEGDDARLADFLTANDPWFMPVVQKTGPDGCLYILDWYDRYHCYQDAHADPEGIDRGKGRLYRVRYQDTPHAQPFDLAKKTDDELIDLLGHPNVFYRETAQRLLAERASPESEKKLERIVFSKSASERDRLCSLWVRWAMPRNRPDGFINTDADLRFAQRLLTSKDTTMRRWGIRLARTSSSPLNTGFQHHLRDYAKDPNPVIRLEALHAAGLDLCNPAVSIVFDAAETSVNDVHLLNLCWRILREAVRGTFKQNLFYELENRNLSSVAFAELLPRLIELLCNEVHPDGASLESVLLTLMRNDSCPDSVLARCLRVVAENASTGALSANRFEGLRETLEEPLRYLHGGTDLSESLISLRALWGDVAAQSELKVRFSDVASPKERRLDALKTLIAADEPDVMTSLSPVLRGTKAPKSFRVAVLAALGSLNDPTLADFLLDNYTVWEPDVRPRVIELLTQRPAWSVTLLKAIDAKQIDKDALNLNQIARVASFRDEEVQKLVAKVYGQVRGNQRSDRQQVMKQIRLFLRATPGDPTRGYEAFKKVCAQCHKIYGEGAEVGPDVTRNGRNDWNQLLVNVLDPSAVIGPGYQARVLITTDGRVLTGLAVEESDRRVVLKIQGGKTETIPRDQIEAYQVSEVSMMPEQLEKQLNPQEIADLFSFLALDKPPSDTSGTYLPGAPRHSR